MLLEVYFLAVLAAVISTCDCFPSPTAPNLVARAGTPSSMGINGGFYYAWWTDTIGDANYTNAPGGSYSMNWTGNMGNFFGGKGWNPSSTSRVVSYEGTFEPRGNAYLSLYGWNPTAYSNDYYVLESYGTYNPANYSPLKGKITCNGANYDVIDVIRIPQGLEPTIHHFYSVRNPKRPNGHVSGTIDFACHVAGWASFGMKLPSNLTYQILATEGYYSSGFSNITVL